MVILEQQSNTFKVSFIRIQIREDFKPYHEYRKNTLMYDGERQLNNLGAQVLMDSTEFSSYCAATQVCNAICCHSKCLAENQTRSRSCARLPGWRHT